MFWMDSWMPRPWITYFVGELMFLISLWRVCLRIRICTRISCNLLSTVARLGKRRANNFSQTKKWIVLLLESRSASWKYGSFLLCWFSCGLLICQLALKIYLPWVIIQECINCLNINLSVAIFQLEPLLMVYLAWKNCSKLEHGSMGPK